MPEEHDEFKDDLKQFLDQPDDNGQLGWIEGNRAGVTDRLPLQGEEKEIAIPQASTRAALEQILNYTKDKVMMVAVVAILLGLLGLACANALRLWLMGELKKK